MESDLCIAKNLLSNARKNKGKFNIDNFVLKKRKRKWKPVKYSACEQVFSSHKRLTQHIKDDHPEFKYSCHYCPKKFESASGKYQYQARHKGLKFKCSVESCGKLFQFGYQYRSILEKDCIFVAPGIAYKRSILKKDCIFVAPEIAAEYLQQREQGHSTKKKHSITENQFICGFKASDDASDVQKNSKERLIMINI